MSTLKIIDSYGVGSSRYLSCLPHRPLVGLLENEGEDKGLYSEPHFILTVPMGGGIVDWNVKTKQRVGTYKQLHDDVITCLLSMPPINRNSDDGRWYNRHHFFISASYSGGIGVWDYEWKERARFELPSPQSTKLMHMSVDYSYSSFPLIRLAVSCEHDSCKISVLQLDFSVDPEYPCITLVTEIKDRLYYFAELNGHNQLVVVQQEFNGESAIKRESQPVVKVEMNTVHVISIDIDTNTELLHKTLPSGPECIVVVRNQQDSSQLALARGRVIEILDISTLSILSTTKCEGSGFIKDMIFTQDYLIVPSTNSELLFYKLCTGGEESNYKLVYRHRGNHGVVYAVKWAIPNERLWIFDEAGIHSLYIDKSNLVSTSVEPFQQVTENYSLLYHQITCCGIDFNSIGTMVACGDFLGNVLVWSLKSTDTNSKSSDINIYDKPIYSKSFGIPVRAISWSGGGSDQFMLVGLMDGSLIHWNLDRNEDDEESSMVVSNLIDGITSIQWDHLNERVAVGTTGGHLNIYRFNQSSQQQAQPIYYLESSILAHEPKIGPQDLRFGSINQFAEIWSLVFHPTDPNLLATVSEDQTTAIWRINGGGSTLTKDRVLTGHTTAVTCVDWMVAKSMGTILATCADDQTVRIWNTDNWQEISVFKTTNDVGEWHTVTYLTLIQSHDNSCYVVCATQNGWIFVWNINSKEKVFSKRVHMGSIEGLKWNKVSNKYDVDYE
eukprot:gene1336-1684_t